jgi:hypothetical protein
LTTRDPVVTSDLIRCPLGPAKLGHLYGVSGGLLLDGQSDRISCRRGSSWRLGVQVKTILGRFEHNYSLEAVTAGGLPARVSSRRAPGESGPRSAHAAQNRPKPLPLKALDGIMPFHRALPHFSRRIIVAFSPGGRI